MADENDLTTQEYWRDSFWAVADSSLPDVTLQADDREFKEVHRRLKRHLPKNSEMRCLEIGCCPGRYLWYFHKTYDYQVEGVEYVELAAIRTQQALDQENVPAKIYAVDMFEFQVPDDRRYDVVCSVGLVEHFHHIDEPLRRHLDLLKPGGLLVVWVPNHRGLCGWILRCIQPDVFAGHNRMGWRDLKGSLERLNETEIITGGYWGRWNLAPSNFLPWLRSKVPYYPYRVVEKLHNLMLRWNVLLPDSWVFSPYVGVIARKRP